MKCPACKTNRELSLNELHHGFKVRVCSECEGFWIPSFQYRKWQSKNGNILPEKDVEVEPTISDSGQGKFCPECDSYLANREVGHGLNFTVDHCLHCRGFWLDKGEWDALSEKNLHDELHRIFSEQWQNELKKIQSDQAAIDVIIKAIGQEDFEKIKSFKGWLYEHHKTGVIINYLTNQKFPE